jgi:hypothetical protein
MARFAFAGEKNMSDRSMVVTMASTDILTRLRTVEEHHPAVVAFAAALLAGGAVIGAMLLQGREIETAPPPSLTYQQCAGMQDHANRLACYDDVTRQTPLLSAQNARRMSFGELLGAQRSDQSRNAASPQR